MIKNIAFKTLHSDKFLAGLLAVIVFISILSSLTFDCIWGDDYAAYLNQAIAIAEGRFEQQTALNAYMHPTSLPEESKGSDLVYVWGYSLIEAAVYKIVGFDRVNYQSIIYYKLISFFFLSILASILYLFFRRRLAKGISFFLCYLVCMHPYLRELSSYMYSDLVFFLFSWLCFYFAESISFKDKISGRIIFKCIIYGFCMWAANAIRLNGFTVIIVSALLHIKSIISEQKQKKSRQLLLHLLPYLIFAALTLIFNYLIFAPPTSNLSDFNKINFSVFLDNIKTYAGLIATFLLNLVGVSADNWKYNIVFWCLLVLLVYGLIRAWRKEFIFIVFVFSTFLTLLFLPYTQGMRYFVNTFPIFALLLGYSYTGLKQLIKKKSPTNTFLLMSGFVSGATFVLSVILFCSCWSNNFTDILQGKDVRGKYNFTAYSSPAIEAYRYIQENTPEDAVIAYSKPRALYLNTERISFYLGSNGHSIQEADYYFCRNNNDAELPLEIWESGMLQMVWTNNEFTLFSVN